jgi:hypothetical protein
MAIATGTRVGWGRLAGFAGGGRPLLGQRRLQIALGSIWLLDGILQFQPSMFTRSFLTEIIAPNATGQPAVVAWPITLAERLIEPRLAIFNSFAATIQILIGLGLLYRPTVRIALLTSFTWAFGIWWVGEGLGGLFTGAASPLTGAPGAALLYVFAGLVAWPRADPPNTVGPLLAWTALWLGSAVLWLLPANRTADAVQNQIASAPSGAPWLSNLETTVSTAAQGHGATIAIIASALSAAIGLLALPRRWGTPLLALTLVLALAYFVLGQGMGGILTGAATDPGTAPLLILIAVGLPTYHTRRSGPRTPRRYGRTRQRLHIR